MAPLPTPVAPFAPWPSLAAALVGGGASATGTAAGSHGGPDAPSPDAHVLEAGARPAAAPAARASRTAAATAAYGASHAAPGDAASEMPNGVTAGLGAALAPSRPAVVPATGSPGGPHAPALLDAVLDALRSERRLVDDLATTMRRQREAVAVDDLGAVDDTVFATHRIVATLGQARLRRRQLNRLLAGRDEVGVRDLADVVGPQMTDALRAAADGLAEAAGALAREVDVNRRVLRDALAQGESHARILAGGDELPRLAVHQGGYGLGTTGTGSMGTTSAAGARPAALVRPPAGGLLVNRTA
jgi:hypothetical protein